jgi:hypothetical protein
VPQNQQQQVLAENFFFLACSSANFSAFKTPPHMKYLLLVALSLSFLPLFSQQVDLSKDFADWKPRNIGPSSMSGRIVGIDGVNSNPNIIYICSASGGVWKTTNGGITWEPVFDQQATLNMGSIAIQQSNPDVVWAGTGEGNPRNSLNLGEGIYKSLDAGKTWKKMGLEKTRNIYRIVIDPSDPNTVYAGPKYCTATTLRVVPILLWIPPIQINSLLPFGSITVVHGLSPAADPAAVCTLPLTKEKPGPNSARKMVFPKANWVELVLPLHPICQAGYMRRWKQPATVSIAATMVDFTGNW